MQLTIPLPVVKVEILRWGNCTCTLGPPVSACGPLVDSCAPPGDHWTTEYLFIY